MNDRLRRLKLNSVAGIIYQFSLVITGFILPRCFLRFYGSNVNGLISSISRFLSLINVCDMGIGAVVQSALYKPLSDNNTAEISKVFLYSKKFFRKISYILIFYVILLTLIYQKIADRNFTKEYTSTMILAMSISTFGQYFVGISYQLLLNADQHRYIQLIVNTITLVANTAVSILLMYNGATIQIVKLVTSVIYLLRPVFLFIYVSKHYIIDKTAKIDGDAVPEKKSAITQHFAYMIYQNTDVIVLTFFSSYASISIYSTYVLVTTGIKSFIDALLAGFEPLIGNLIATNEKDKLDLIFKEYNWLIHTICVLLFSITGILIVPFILIYTKGVTDADYNNPLFAKLITIAYFFDVIRNSLYAIIKAAGHYKMTQNASLAEAAINVIISIILVFRFGITGVAIGTILAEMFFLAYEIVYLSKNIIFYSIKMQIKQICLDFITSVMCIVSCTLLKIQGTSYLAWAKSAIIVFLICFIICLFMQILFCKSNVHMLINIAKMRTKNSKM